MDGGRAFPAKRRASSDRRNDELASDDMFGYTTSVSHVGHRSGTAAECQSRAVAVTAAATLSRLSARTRGRATDGDDIRRQEGGREEG